MTTTDATTTTMATYTPPVGDSFVVLQFNVTAMGATGDCAAWTVRVAAKHVSGTTSLVGSLVTLSEHKDAGATSWSVSADVSGTAVRLRVTGDAGTSVTWVLQGGRYALTGNGGVASLGGTRPWPEAVPA